MADEDSRTLSFSIYLLKTDIASPDDAMKTGALPAPEEIELANGSTATLYIKRTAPKPPNWISLFTPHIDLAHVYGRNNAAVLIIPTAERLFAVTFGYGKPMLDPSSWEENFGLLVVANSIDPDRIRVADTRSLGAIAGQVRTQASRHSGIGEFGINPESDMLRALVGKTGNDDEATTLAGSDGLKVSLKTTLEDLPEILGEYLDLYGQKAYQQNFDWIDHLRQIKSPSEIKALDEQLLEQLNAGDTTQKWLAIPELIEWANISGFRYSKSARNELHDDIELETFLATVSAAKTLTKQYLTTKHVVAFSTDTDQPRDHWPVWHCLYCELAYDGHQYILSGGHWYRADDGYIASVDAAVANIPTSDVVLPDYDHSSESQYNVAVRDSDSDTWALMDANNIKHAGMVSAIEFCDLMHRDGKLVHVKRYGGSSVLSHLFNQGVVASELFASDAEFRLQVNDKLPASHQLADAAIRPNPDEFEIVYAITSKYDAPLTLPLFSRIALKNADQRLRGFGYHVSLCKIMNRRNATPA